MKTDQVLKFEDVRFVRDGNVILDGVNWSVNENENWVLLGTNGSGKSTLLSMIPAYTYPTSGDVYVFGKKFGKYLWEKVKKDVGFLSSSLNDFNNTFYSQSVSDVIMTGKFATARVFEKPGHGDFDKVERLVREFELERIKDRSFGVLSEGERRRTLIARAFMADYKLLILDEPCANLDIRARERLLSSLRLKMEESETPLIYVTHQIDEILPQITHVAILDQGKIVIKGEKKKVLTDENLSDLYDTKLHIHWEDERPFTIIKS
ncbi:MAG: ATP-binding cassette domain-containing protein [Finegoldia sp.]|nr:ATP-binding cassette domain-containing protein [Finegoldia sp.]